MKGRFQLPPWVFPLLIAALVAGLGFWGNGRLRGNIEKELVSRLTATLDANVMALEIWTTNQLKLATALAADPNVRNLSLAILLQSDRQFQTWEYLQDAEQFATYLRPRLNLMDYEIGQLVDDNFRVVATSPHNLLAADLPISDSHTNKFAELFATGHPVIITPFKPELLVERRILRSSSAQSARLSIRVDVRPVPRGAAGRRGDITLMQVAAPVRDAGGQVVGALAMIINPEREFSRILSVARAGESGETYAFDQTGLLISRSRFDAELRRIGLLASTNSSSALNLRLRDPGGDLTRGYKLTEGLEPPGPLIRLVDEAVAGENGVDVAPARDYRGVPVVGAWRWLPRLGFGVATQIDAEEAYRPLHMLQWLFVTLCLLLLLCATGMFVFSHASVISRRRLNEAELKLKQLGQYTLDEKIGEGGMGVVYRAHHALMRRETAVKLLLPDRADADAIARFEREVVHTCRLAHPNTIQVYDYGHTPEGIFYYAMEYLRGLNLQELVARFGPVPEGRVIYLLAEVCQSLAEAHALGLIHRDIKPGNIFLCHRGGVPDAVKVLDFGLVREYRDDDRGESALTARGAIEGTPWFMPPEAFTHAAGGGPGSDLYSMGALGYYLLTGGKFVFEAKSLKEIHQRQLNEKPLPPGRRTANVISPELERIILRCLEADPAQRPASATELHNLLLACPRARDWSPAERVAWWARYDRQPPAPAGAAAPGKPMPTVRIDIAERMPPAP